jgi:hypothetical protein
MELIAAQIKRIALQGTHFAKESSTSILPFDKSAAKPVSERAHPCLCLRNNYLCFRSYTLYIAVAELVWPRSLA